MYWSCPCQWPSWTDEACCARYAMTWSEWCLEDGFLLCVIHIYVKRYLWLRWLSWVLENRVAVLAQPVVPGLVTRASVTINFTKTSGKNLLQTLLHTFVTSYDVGLVVCSPGDRRTGSSGIKLTAIKSFWKNFLCSRPSQKAVTWQLYAHKLFYHVS
jgi:hypothetical protein